MVNGNSGFHGDVVAVLPLEKGSVILHHPNMEEIIAQEKNLKIQLEQSVMRNKMVFMWITAFILS